ncbi:hypothetical protein Tco_1482228 [Tanacetum coccineum]
MKMKRLVTPSEAARYKSDMKKALNASKDDFIIQFRPKGPGEGSGIAQEVFGEPRLKGLNEEARVTPEVPDGLGDDSSSSSSEIVIEDISSDDDKVPINDADMTMQAEDATDTTVITTESISEVTKNDNTVTLTSGNVKMTYVEMVIDQQVTEEQIPKQQNETTNVDAHIAPFLNEHEHADINLYELLKNPGESEVQSMMDVPVTQATLAALIHPPIESTVTLSPHTTTIPSSLPLPTQLIQDKTKRFVKKSTFPNS